MDCILTTSPTLKNVVSIQFGNDPNFAVLLFLIKFNLYCIYSTEMLYIFHLCDIQRRGLYDHIILSIFWNMI